MTQGTALIVSERERQIQLEGYTLEDDDHYLMGELSKAAACYQAIGRGQFLGGQRTWWATSQGWVKSENDPEPRPKHEPRCMRRIVPGAWPWAPDSWKPSRDPVENYKKAGALLAAEIDRILRMRSRNTEPGF